MLLFILGLFVGCSLGVFLLSLLVKSSEVENLYPEVG
jgi:hypothetical protein